MLHLCDVSVGLLFSCLSTGFTGDAPVEHEARVDLCRVSVGKVVSCPHPYSGEAPLVRDGKVVRCDVRAGFVSRCDATGFTGQAVVAVQ